MTRKGISNMYKGTCFPLTELTLVMLQPGEEEKGGADKLKKKKEKERELKGMVPRWSFFADVSFKKGME